MKKHVITLLVVLISICFTSTITAQADTMNTKVQTVEPIFPYSNPSISQIRDLALSDSPKGRVFLDYLVTITNRYLEEAHDSLRLKPNQEGLDFILSHTFLEESYLYDFDNSGYDTENQAIVASKGHYYEGFIRRFQYNGIDKSLLKANCANVVYDNSRIKNPYDVEAFGKLLLQIIEDKSKLNLAACSKMVAEEKKVRDAEFAAIRAEIKGVKDDVQKQKDAYTAQQERHKMELQEAAFRAKGNDQMLWGAISGLVSLGSWYLYFTPIYKPDISYTDHEVEYQYYKYSLNMTVLPTITTTTTTTSTSSSKSAKGSGFNFGPENCGGEDDDRNHGGDKCGDNITIINKIYETIINNKYITQEIINLITQNITNIQQYITNNNITVEEITKIEQIFKTYNYYTTTNITNIVDPKVYELVETLVNGKIKFTTTDRTMLPVDRKYKEAYKYVAIGSSLLFAYLEYRGLTNIVKSNHIRFYLKQQDLKNTMQQNATANLAGLNPLKNAQLAFTWTFGPKTSYNN